MKDVCACCERTLGPMDVDICARCEADLDREDGDTARLMSEKPRYR